MASMLLPLEVCQQINDGKTSTAFDKTDSPGQAYFHSRGGTGAVTHFEVDSNNLATTGPGHNCVALQEMLYFQCAGQHQR